MGKFGKSSGKGTKPKGKGAATSTAKDPSAALAKKGKGGKAFGSMPPARPGLGQPAAAGGVPAGTPPVAKGSTGGMFGKAGPAQNAASKGGKLPVGKPAAKAIGARK